MSKPPITAAYLVTCVHHLVPGLKPSSIACLLIHVLLTFNLSHPSSRLQTSFALHFPPWVSFLIRDTDGIKLLCMLLLVYCHYSALDSRHNLTCCLMYHIYSVDNLPLKDRAYQNVAGSRHSYYNCYEPTLGTKYDH